MVEECENPKYESTRTRANDEVSPYGLHVCVCVKPMGYEESATNHGLRSASLVDRRTDGLVSAHGASKANGAPAYDFCSRYRYGRDPPSLRLFVRSPGFCASTSAALPRET